MQFELNLRENYRMEDFVITICNNFMNDFYEYIIKSFKTTVVDDGYIVTIISVNQRHYYKKEMTEFTFKTPKEFIEKFKERFHYSDIEIMEAMISDYGGVFNREKAKIVQFTNKEPK